MAMFLRARFALGIHMPRGNLVNEVEMHSFLLLSFLADCVTHISFTGSRGGSGHAVRGTRLEVEEKETRCRI